MMIIYIQGNAYAVQDVLHVSHILCSIPSFFQNDVNLLSLQPLAVIVCPGWKKAQLIFELLRDYSVSSRPLHPMLLTIGLHKDEAKNMKLPRGCKHPSKLFGFPYRAQWNPAQAGCR